MGKLCTIKIYNCDKRRGFPEPGKLVIDMKDKYTLASILTIITLVYEGKKHTVPAIIVLAPIKNINSGFRSLTIFFKVFNFSTKHKAPDGSYDQCLHHPAPLLLALRDFPTAKKTRS